MKKLFILCLALGMLLTLAGLVVVLSMVVMQISDLFATVKSVFGL